MVAVSNPKTTIVVRRGAAGVSGVAVRRASGRTLSFRTTRTILTGAGTEYEHTQSVASASWTVNHNLGRRPAAVSVLSVGGVEVDAAVTHISTNQLVVEFAAPQVGSVRAS